MIPRLYINRARVIYTPVKPRGKRRRVTGSQAPLSRHTIIRMGSRYRKVVPPPSTTLRIVIHKDVCAVCGRRFCAHLGNDIMSAAEIHGAPWSPNPYRTPNMPLLDWTCQPHPASLRPADRIAEHIAKRHITLADINKHEQFAIHIITMGKPDKEPNRNGDIMLINPLKQRHPMNTSPDSGFDIDWSASGHLKALSFHNPSATPLYRAYMEGSDGKLKWNTANQAWEPETPKPKCPDQPRFPGDTIGCGSTNLSEPDEEGLVDCHDCGMWHDPRRETNPVELSRRLSPRMRPDPEEDTPATAEQVTATPPYPTCHHCKGEMKHTLLESWCTTCGFVSNIQGSGWPHEGNEDDLRDTPPPNPAPKEMVDPAPLLKETNPLAYALATIRKLRPKEGSLPPSGIKALSEAREVVSRAAKAQPEPLEQEEIDQLAKLLTELRNPGPELMRLAREAVDAITTLERIPKDNVTAEQQEELRQAHGVVRALRAASWVTPESLEAAAAEKASPGPDRLVGSLPIPTYEGRQKQRAAIQQLRIQQPEVAGTGLAATVLATQLNEAMRQDPPQRPGRFGPAVAKWLRGLAGRLMAAEQEDSGKQKNEESLGSVQDLAPEASARSLGRVSASKVDAEVGRGHNRTWSSGKRQVTLVGSFPGVAAIPAPTGCPGLDQWLAGDGPLHVLNTTETGRPIKWSPPEHSAPVPGITYHYEDGDPRPSKVVLTRAALHARYSTAAIAALQLSDFRPFPGAVRDAKMIVFEEDDIKKWFKHPNLCGDGPYIQVPTAAPVPQADKWADKPIVDDFSGDDVMLKDSIQALIRMHDSDSLVPHGIGGHARALLAACYHRLQTEDRP
jgi:hypothetical protein